MLTYIVNTPWKVAIKMGAKTPRSSWSGPWEPDSSVTILSVYKGGGLGAEERITTVYYNLLCPLPAGGP